MTNMPSTIQVVIPLKLTHRNGRPRVVPPDNSEAVEPDTQEPHLLRAIARAWNWRRMLERGEVRRSRTLPLPRKQDPRYDIKQSSPNYSYDRTR